MNPVAVEIIRPKPKVRDAVAAVIGKWATTFGQGGIVMLLIGACHHVIDHRIPAVGYWQVVLGIFTVRAVVAATGTWDSYKVWTRERPK